MGVLFSVLTATPPPPNFAKIHARGARGLQRIAPRDLIPPPGAQTFAEQSGKVYRGAGRVGGRVGGLGRGRAARGRRGTPRGQAARDAEGGLARDGQQAAEPGRRAGPLGPQRGHVAAAAGLLQQPGKRAGRAAGANVGPNLGGSRASQAVPNLPGPVCGQKRRKNRGRRPKTGSGAAQAGPFSGAGGARRAAVWQKHCDPPPQKATQTPYCDHGSGRGGRFAPAYALYK